MYSKAHNLLDGGKTMISICIPTYNRLPYLKQCFSSVFNGFGDYPYEVIIADGVSTDGTLEYPRGLDNIKLIETGELTVYDWLLEQTVVFNDKNYDHLEDFFLTQRYPDEILS